MDLRSSWFEFILPVSCVPFTMQIPWRVRVCVCALFIVMSLCVRLEKALQRRIRDNDRLIQLKASIHKQKEEVRTQW
jgi:hypothetical protein